MRVLFCRCLRGEDPFRFALGKNRIVSLTNENEEGEVDKVFPGGKRRRIGGKVECGIKPKIMVTSL